MAFGECGKRFVGLAGNLQETITGSLLQWSEVVAELLCWGWVDGSVRKIDDARIENLISHQKTNSA